MSIEAGWDNPEKTAFLWTFHGSWTWREYNEALERCNALALEVDHPIDVIVDIRAGSIFPSHILSNLRASKATQPAKLGRVVIVGGNLFVRSVLEAVNKILKHLANRISFADSVEAARAELARYRAAQDDRTDQKVDIH